MSASGGKVITSLRDRWQIEQEIDAMLRVYSQEEFSTRAQRVAASGDQVIPVILGHLDHVNARTLSALGAVASLYPHREQILNKLYEAAADLDRPDRGRVSAMLILERFLGQEPDPYLIATLDDPQFMAVESIREMIREGERDPHVLVEYARTLTEQPAETIQGVIETLLEVGKERAVPALCLLAQGDADVLGEAALLALGRLRHPDAARGLQSIIPLLPSQRRLAGERSLRKLQLKQVPVSPLPSVDDAWRALISPVDGEGNQVVWFVHDPDERSHCRFLGLSIHEREGIRQAYGHHDLAADMLPERRPLGHVHAVVLQGVAAQADEPSPGEQGQGAILYMLETDFDHGRRLAREGQALNFKVGHPLPAEYRLLGPWLWQYDDAQVHASRQPGLRPAITAGSLAETANLLFHPVFRGWFAYGERVLQHTMTLLRRMPVVAHAVSADEVTRLSAAYFDGATIERLRARLEAMGEWLWRAGESHLAGLAMVAVETLGTTPPADHPFTRSMVELGLKVVLEQLRRM